MGTGGWRSIVALQAWGKNPLARFYRVGSRSSSYDATSPANRAGNGPFTIVTGFDGAGSFGSRVATLDHAEEGSFQEGAVVLAQTKQDGTKLAQEGKEPKAVVPGSVNDPPKEHPEFKPLTGKGETTTFPLPAFGYNRNEQYWVGALAVTLKGNEQGEVEDILAPQVLYNPLVGAQATMNYYGYRSNNVQYRAVASYSEKVAKYFDLAYKNMGAGGGRYIFATQFSWFKNPFARFFGLGNRAPLYNETNYTSREGVGKLTVGINLGPALSLMFTERYRDVRVEDGIISTLPSTKSRFGDTTGMGGAQIFGSQLSILYDRRNDLLTPSSGTYVNVSAELASNVVRSAPNRWGHYVVDMRHLHPHDSGRKVFVARMLFESVTGRKVPFYELPTLGGENTLRAFGLQRFVDDQALLVNFEERIRVLTKRAFDHDIDLEVAPSLDIGRVSSKLIDRFKNFQVNPGVGLRVMARPNVVGRVDIAYGKDGSNAFVGLDYPF